MFNPYQTKSVVIRKIIKESSDAKRFVLEFQDKEYAKQFDFLPGQFIEISIPGFNEAPFTFGSSSKNKEFFEIAVRDVGSLTSALSQMKVSDEVGMRGPFGNGFPMDLLKSRNLLLVSGGCGFVPLRSVTEEYLDRKDEFEGKLQVFYGARSYDDLLFKDDFEKWLGAGIDLNLKVDKQDKSCDSSKFKCDTGLVTELFGKVDLVERPVVFICGPPLMAKFVIQELDKLKVEYSDIYISLERRMECGLGVCEHCAVGPYYVCKDGPVFSWDKIEWIPGII